MNVPYREITHVPCIFTLSVNARLLLFDIDHTLVNSAGCGRRAMENTFAEFFRISSAFQGISLNGKTDPQILFEVLEKWGLTQALTPKRDLLFWERYVTLLKKELKNSKDARVEDGVFPLLESLRQQPAIRLGLLTGNVKEGAKAKLEPFGLWDDFPVGAFGSDHPDRNVVAQIAVTRCRKFYQIPFSPDDIFVIGDSHRDIACAAAIHARCVAVATGLDSAALLQSSNPFLLLPNLANTQEVLNLFVPQRKP